MFLAGLPVRLVTSFEGGGGGHEFPSRADTVKRVNPADSQHKKSELIYEMHSTYKNEKSSSKSRYEYNIQTI